MLAYKRNTQKVVVKEAAFAPLFFILISCYYTYMLSWRLKRQLVVILVFLSPLIIVGGFLGVKFFPESSCFDSKKNQGEIGVDCGGPCAPCELKNPRAVQIFWVRTVPVRENVYDVAALIQNPNAVLSADNVSYEFVLFDEFGPVARVLGKTFLLAQERTHVIEVNINTVRAPNRVEFRINEVNWGLREDPRANIIVERRAYKVAREFGIERSVVEADLLNRSSLEFREVMVNVLLFDGVGNVVGVTKALVENLLSGTTKSIKTSWPGVIQGEVSTIEVEPRVNIFDPSIILQPR